jgi:NifB/MoaA-like Fe-S oxidoreductase
MRRTLMSDEMDRTRQGALEVLLSLRPAILSEIPDERARTLLTENLVNDVLREAWRNAFEENRTVFRSRLRQLVGDAIEERKLREKD